MNRIGLVHAVPMAIAPVQRAFASVWPEATLHNLLDEGLAPDLEAQGRLTEHLHRRIHALGELTVLAGAQGVLYTCSAFAEAIERTASLLPVPVLKPDEAMFSAALKCGRHIGLLATFEPAIAGTEAAFRRQAAALGAEVTLDTICVPEAIAAARCGDVAAHDALVAAAVPRLAHCDVIMLAHFSTSTALEPARRAARQPVLSAPEAAVRELKSRIESSNAAA